MSSRTPRNSRAAYAAEYESLPDGDERQATTMGTRPERVREAIRQEISLIIQKEIKDPRLGFLTVTGVDLTPDLRYARVYFSTLGERKDKILALKGLRSAKGYIKGRLADKIKLRFMPEIEFKIDESFERAKTVYGILDTWHKEVDGKEKRDERDQSDDSGHKKA